MAKFPRTLNSKMLIEFRNECNQQQGTLLAKSAESSSVIVERPRAATRRAIDIFLARNRETSRIRPRPRELDGGAFHAALDFRMVVRAPTSTATRISFYLFRRNERNRTLDPFLPEKMVLPGSEDSRLVSARMITHSIWWRACCPVAS